MGNIVLFVLYSIILFLPAYIANPGAVITGGHIKIDMGNLCSYFTLAHFKVLSNSYNHFYHGTSFILNL